VLERLSALHPKSIDLSLDRTVQLLDLLGRPQDRLPPVIHVAGTNGKGSVIAMVRACLEAAGYSVHVYSSPHLVRFAERIRLAGRLIDEPQLLNVLEHCDRVNQGRPITYFEITTAAAFKAFADVPADILLLETGLGGRHDSTNVVDRPAATCITPVSMDHMHFLGDTLEAIAAEKAAIQKPGVPSIVGPQAETAAAVIEQAGNAAGAALYRHGQEWTLSKPDGHLRYQSDTMTIDVPLPSLEGPHQWQNAGIALALADRLRADGFRMPDAALAAAMARVDWPGRLQPLDRGRLVHALPDSWELWLDGGHNPAAGDALAQAVGAWPPRTLNLVVGMLNSKDPEPFLAPLAPHATAVTAITIPEEQNALPAEAIAAAAERVGLTSTVAPDLAQALSLSSAPTAGPGRVLICGSLYLAGHVLEANGTLPD